MFLSQIIVSKWIRGHGVIPEIKPGRKDALLREMMGQEVP